MKRILITGATGNIGSEVIRFLMEMNSSDEIIVGVRDINKAAKEFQKYTKLKFVCFDFENQDTFETAFTGNDCIFLLRPPHISDVETYFRPLVDKLKKIK